MKATYDAILKLGCQVEQALDNAMTLCQSWGFNGFKRLYRYYNKKLHCDLIALSNEMYDNHELIAPLTHDPYPAYSPSGIKDHAYKWYATMKDACIQISKLNLQLVQQCGYQSKITSCMIKDFYKLKEKAHRFVKRGEKVEWMAHDLHVYDDILHEKIKKKEKKHK